MRSLSKAVIAVLGVFLVAGCKSSTAVNGDASGTYNLSAINNAPLPFTLSSTATDSLVITSGSITINTDGTFTEILTSDATTGGVTTTNTSVCPGTYSQSGNSFTFNEATTSDVSCGGSYGASWDGSSTVSLFFTGYQLDYTKASVAL